MPFVRLCWRFQAERHFRTLLGKLWRFDKEVPVNVPDDVLAVISEQCPDVLEQVEEVQGKPGKWKPIGPSESRPRSRRAAAR